MRVLSLVGPVIYILAYYIVMWIAKNIVVSIVAFFHFLLEHPMATVEDWLSYNNQEIAMVIKVFSFYIVYKWYCVKKDPSYSILKDMKKINFRPTREIFVIVASLVFSVLVLGKLQERPEFSLTLFSMLKSYIAVAFFYYVDAILIVLIVEDIMDKLSHLEKAIFAIGLSFISFAFNYWSFEGDALVNLSALVFWFAVIWLPYNSRSNSINFLTYFVMCFLAPFRTLIGSGTFLGREAFPFTLGREIGGAEWLGLFLACYLYQLYQKKKMTSLIGSLA